VRIGVAWAEAGAGAVYRAEQPMREMERRGHEVVWPLDDSGAIDVHRLARCDVVHVYRSHDPASHGALKELAARGVSITWDNDDDFTAIPREHPRYRQFGGVGGRHVFGQMVQVARLAHVVTTTSDQIAARYRCAGARRVEVIPNCLPRDATRRPRRHDGIVVGWVAALEHVVDARRLGIRDVLLRLIRQHPAVRVATVGLDLDLGERYRYEGFVPYDRLGDRIRAFDVGIAPLADIPFNRARSDVKLKEYAACGVPWLASPVGPYTALGEAEGGRLVADDGWCESLESLVLDRRDRRRLARRARVWAKRTTIARVAERWEAVFVAAATRAPVHPTQQLAEYCQDSLT
jgi:glycosyltransferase involved in cell wall biosynthesis